MVLVDGCGTLFRRPDCLSIASRTAYIFGGSAAAPQELDQGHVGGDGGEFDQLAPGVYVTFLVGRQDHRKDRTRAARADPGLPPEVGPGTGLDLVPR
jgi:hypothetical protein